MPQGAEGGVPDGLSQTDEGHRDTSLTVRLRRTDAGGNTDVREMNKSDDTPHIRVIEALHADSPNTVEANIRENTGSGNKANNILSSTRKSTSGTHSSTNHATPNTNSHTKHAPHEPRSLRSKKNLQPNRSGSLDSRPIVQAFSRTKALDTTKSKHPTTRSQSEGRNKNTLSK